MSRRGGSAAPPGTWSGRQVTEARAVMAKRLPATCGRCGNPVTTTDNWVVGHIKSRATHPELTNDPNNWQIEHRACSDATGQAAVIEKAKHDALTAAGVFPHPDHDGKPPPLSIHTPGDTDVEQRYPTSDFPVLIRAKSAPWLHAFADVPEDAAPPRFMSPAHPRAVGSYGHAAIEWIESELAIRLRWWQRLAIVRQLEHDADGVLCWTTVVESCPRRSGKSVRLRSLALWRISHPDLFGEPQLVLHTGRDLPIAREIHRAAWRWVERHRRALGWTVRKGMGNEEIETDTADRWLVRSVNGVYGYDVGLGMVDEGWDVEPRVVDEGLEPAMLERKSPQLHLTSSAHRRATSLMRSRIAAALMSEPDNPDTLILLWGAHPADDPASERTWRAASPHWTEQRRAMIASKYAKALAGEEDPEADDPDPMEGFVAQYLNVWRLRAARTVTKGESAVSQETWLGLLAAVPERSPDAVAVESWYSDGVTVAAAWVTDDGVVVRASDLPTLDAAAQEVAHLGCRGYARVGKSLADDPAWRAHGVRVQAMTTTTAAATLDLVQYATEGTLRHDGSEHLRAQVLGLRTAATADGVRVVSTDRADAVKAAVWAVSAARRRRAGRPRIVLPKAS